MSTTSGQLAHSGMNARLPTFPREPEWIRTLGLHSIQIRSAFGEGPSMHYLRVTQTMRGFLMKHTKNEFENFDKVMTKLLKVPHSEIRASLDAEKAAKKR